jgi:hypothetical protein
VDEGPAVGVLVREAPGEGVDVGLGKSSVIDNGNYTNSVSHIHTQSQYIFLT